MTEAAIRRLQPGDEAGWNAARLLVEQYAASLNVDLGFQNFDDELAHLSTQYGPPDGAFLVAQQGERFVGCVGVRKFTSDTAEMKRLWVDPHARGGGIGRLLAAGAIETARTLGYARLVLDTLPTMAEARALYRSLGFTETPAYRFNPVDGTAFLELELR